jgi:dolichol-phosphate mannosyltransferase
MVCSIIVDDASGMLYLTGSWNAKLRRISVAGGVGTVTSYASPGSEPTGLALLDGVLYVIASRFQAGSVVQGVPFFRQVLSWGCFLMMKTLLPYRNVRDYSTGFRAYRSLTLGRLIKTSGPKFIEDSSFACMLELLLSLRWVGARAVEIPYTLRYDLKVGVSKMRIMRTIRRYFNVIGKYWAKDVLPQAEEPSLHELRSQLRA